MRAPRRAKFGVYLCKMVVCDLFYATMIVRGCKVQ